MGKRVTICDVAKEAGVSVCCVSWVLQNHPRSREVGLLTRQKVLAAAEKIGYLRNQLASAVRTGQVNTIAVILHFNEGQDMLFLNQIMEGILQEASCRKFNIKVFSDNDLEETFRNILENRIEHIISASLAASVREETALFAEQHALKLVFIYEHGHGKFPVVNTNNVEMSQLAVSCLYRKGHRRIALLCVPHLSFYVKERHKGYYAGMEEMGLQVDPGWVICSDEIEKSVEEMLSLPGKRRPTAFIALDDFCAARALRCAWKMGVRIPEEFSIIGMGDTEVARSAIVPLTSIREFFPENGKMLVRLLLGEKPETPPDGFMVYHTHAELVERESVYDLSSAFKKRRRG